MSWGEIAGVGGLIVTILAMGFGSYIAVIKNNVSLKKDIDNSFSKIRDLEDDINNLNKRLSLKGETLMNIKDEFYEVLKRKEAENIYAKKDIVMPMIKSIQDTQKAIVEDIRELKTQTFKQFQEVNKELREISKSVIQVSETNKAIYKYFTNLEKGA